ncbi:PREDICTED: uncharacterized protein LOC104760100 [Camelina sativa]|uniref:Uncharacterized protein LOC104760100 n=1 Tax=Camelina sativa TaxID=90675 RepID=A0ABM0X5Y3_CAMSA|nr:PREDICTED: uncharacterized protein LOC104760100 [Camelina sativa]
MSILIFSILILSTFLSVSGQKKPSVYEVLQNYTLPRGILPEGVRDYQLNRKTGVFKVHFNSTCQFPIESYKVKYKSTISGIISRGRVMRLMGVSVKVLFFWLNISEVSRDGDDVEFSVGAASEEFSAKYFVDSPQCGCGYNCYNGPVSSS